MIDFVSHTPVYFIGVSKVKGHAPRRDWVLLPLTGLIVLGLLAASSEFVSRRILTTNGKSGDDCLIRVASSTGPRGIPNCVCVEKILEAPLTEYRFNSNGFRNDKDFVPKASGVFRIAMIGTSFAAGFRVPEKLTFATLLPAELSQRTGRTVELYNEGIPMRSAQMIANGFKKDVLATNPDLVLWIVCPSDLRRSDWLVRANVVTGLNMWAKLRYYITSASNKPSLAASAKELFSHTATSWLLEVLLYRNSTLYVRSSLLNDANDMGYLKSLPQAQLLQNLHEFDLGAGEIEREAKTSGVPVVVVSIPDRTQSSMVSANSWPAGVDPYMLSNKLSSIVASHGWTYINTLSDYQSIPNPQLGYFVLDGHPNAKGHAMISRILAKHLTAGAVPALKATSLD
jgi:hypothetical protein